VFVEYVTPKTIEQYLIACSGKSEVLTDTKHRAASLQQQSYLCYGMLVFYFM